MLEQCFCIATLSLLLASVFFLYVVQLNQELLADPRWPSAMLAMIVLEI